MTDPTTLPDRELDLAIGAAYLDGDKARLKELEDEHDRRRRDEARHRLAEAERARRSYASAEAERVALLAKLTQQLGDLDQQHRDDLDALDSTSQAHAYGAIERAYISGRLSYWLSNDLQGATGDRRFYRAYRTPDELIARRGATANTFLLSIKGRTLDELKGDPPWANDVKRLKELTNRTVWVGNGG